MYLDRTATVLNEARAFYLELFLSDAGKLDEKVCYFSEKHQEMRERKISAQELLTWAEAATCATKQHPHPWAGWNFSERFPQMPFEYRRSVIKDAIGKARSYLSNLAHWQKTGKKKGKPGLPGASNHPTLYEGTLRLDLSESSKQDRFVRLKVYTGQTWQWHNYPVRISRYFEQRLRDGAWEKESPKLVLRKRSATLHFAQTREIQAKKVVESKQDPNLVTVGVDLNVKNLAVITVRQHDQIIQTVFLTDHGLDQASYRHLKRIAKKQHLSGKPVKGEESNQDLWRHVRRMNEDAARHPWRARLLVCVPGIPAVCCSLSGCAKSSARVEVNRGA